MLEAILYIAFTINALVLGIAARQLFVAFKKFSPPNWRSELGVEIDLPSVTVCIPARNEQHALTDCLQKVIKSKYEKLEIIVLDDVSNDDTTALIKSFASEGVRFVKGSPLSEGWLGKNHALQGLLQEASGSYLLFMDVDTRLEPQAVENTVRYALSHNASMVSVMPRREDGWRLSVIFSPLRYFWELLFHRKTTPASSSNAWLIRRKVLDDELGGFEPIKNAIQPEAQLASQLAASNRYRFLIGTSFFGIGYEKKWRSQLITSVRLLFPLLHNQTFLSVFVVLDLLLMLLPFAVLVSFTVTEFQVVHIVALMLVAGSYALYGVYTRRMWRKGWIIGMLFWPALLIQEACLILISAIQYKRKAITWKGRSIRPEAQN